MVIGLTGGIGCGKSTASAVLQSLGAAVADADAISRDLTKAGGLAIPAIRAAFGPEYITPEGAMDRKAVGAAVFADREKLAVLNGVLHPMVENELRRFIQSASSAGSQVIVLDVPLLFETGMNRLCDRVLCVTVPLQEQLRRVMERDGLPEEAAQARINSQMPLCQKESLSDDVLSTDRPLEETRAELLRLWEKYTAQNIHDTEAP